MTNAREVKSLNLVQRATDEKEFSHLGARVECGRKGGIVVNGIGVHPVSGPVKIGFSLLLFTLHFDLYWPPL